MATIRPFHAIRPHPFYADQLVFTSPRENAPSTLKSMLETATWQLPETETLQAAAYRQVEETLQGLLSGGQLWREQRPGVYVYEIAGRAGRFTGIWTLTDLADYRAGRIKTHELTFSASVWRMKNYRENTGLEGSPVLLAYQPDEIIDHVIRQTKEKTQQLTMGNGEGMHRIWKIEDGETMEALVAAFKKIEAVYLADGHHRLESACLTPYGTISSLYMASNQLQVLEYDRVCLPDAKIEKTELFCRLLKNFHLQPALSPVRPKEKRRFGMLLEGEWYHLLPKPHIGIAPDAALLQNEVLAPVFGVNCPGTDARLKCIGGGQALEELQSFVNDHPHAVAFTLCPVSIDEIIRVADAGGTLPPKSSWIDPKVPYGLIMHKH